MSMRDPLLAIHIAAGTSGLILGPLAMLSPKRGRPHMPLGEIYHWVMLVICLSGAALAILAWDRIWWLLPIAAFSYSNALLGYLAAKRRRPGWLGRHIRGMGGSYIALVTALLVVTVARQLPITWFSLTWFFLPTIVGSPFIRWVLREVDRGRRPKRTATLSWPRPASYQPRPQRADPF
jgi:uncharacterized membrane protein